MICMSTWVQIASPCIRSSTLSTTTSHVTQWHIQNLIEYSYASRHGKGLPHKNTHTRKHTANLHLNAARMEISCCTHVVGAHTAQVVQVHLNLKPVLVGVVYEPADESAAHAIHQCGFTSRWKVDKLLESALQQIDFATSSCEHVSIVSTMLCWLLAVPSTWRLCWPQSTNTISRHPHEFGFQHSMQPYVPRTDPCLWFSVGRADLCNPVSFFSSG